MEDERCETCRFWLGYDSTEGDRITIGACRRYPPHQDLYQLILLAVLDAQGLPGRVDQLIDRSSDERYKFPRTLSEEWCGEYKEKT